MLKSLHQLQVENRRLEEQIKNLTAKKERLQLLNAQLSVPFPTITTNPSPSHQMHAFSAQNGKYGNIYCICSGRIDFHSLLNSNYVITGPHLHEDVEKG